MHLPSQPRPTRRMLHSRRRRVAADKPVPAVRLALVPKRCRRPSGACHHGGPAHPAHHLTSTDGGTTRTVYVPPDRVAAVRSGVAESQRLKARRGAIRQVTLALVRHHVRDRRHRGRP